MRMRPQSQSKLTYRRTFKVRPAPDGFYVVDCRGVWPGTIVAWFAGSEEAVREAHARSRAVDSGQSSVDSGGGEG